MKKPVKPNRPDTGKLDWNDQTKLNEHYHEDGKEQVVLYSDSQRLVDHCDYDDWCDECNNEGCEECQVNSKDHVSIESLTLQDIIDKIPEGYTPSDVKMSLGMQLNQMGISNTDCFWINFVYRAPVSLQEELDKYAKEQERYDKGMVKYKEAKKKYDKWKQDQDIVEMQAKIDKMKAKQ